MLLEGLLKDCDVVETTEDGGKMAASLDIVKGDSRSISLRVRSRSGKLLVPSEGDSATLKIYGFSGETIFEAAGEAVVPEEVPVPSSYEDGGRTYMFTPEVEAGFVFKITAAATSGLVSGQYAFAATVVHGDGRYTVAEGYLMVRSPAENIM